MRDPWAYTPIEPTEPTQLIDPRRWRFVAPRTVETVAGLAYLPMHMLVVPILLSIVFMLSGQDYYDNALFNLLYMLTGTVYLTHFMRRYLGEGFTRFRQFGQDNLWVIPLGYGITFAANIAIAIVLSLFAGELANPNQEAIEEVITQSFLPALLMTVVLAPIVEELLFRGAIFAPLRKKNRILAYAVSTFLFAFVHIAGFLFFAPPSELLPVMLLYIPAGITFAWVYEKSGSIWTAIALHALWNLIATLLAFLPDLPYYPY